MAEYKGIIVEVYEIIEIMNSSGIPETWYKLEEYKNRWGFHGTGAPDHIREEYLNKSIAHHKKRGAANPIRFSL